MIAGRYTLVREVGRGGMGAVWLGRDEVLGREVALKRIGAMPGGDEADLERAAREARLAARLNHPHVVAVFDLVQERDDQWLVMEYVEGAPLSELIRAQGSLQPDEVAPILDQVADALTAAHAAGIVHRDVKPSNILVTPEGQVKLSDFGIARAQADVTLTRTGLVTGSPAYLAPEVASGRPATAASDVWSLGATTYHALAGHPPYEVGENLLGALYRIVHEEPPRLADAGWMTSLLANTMTRDPQQRWTMAQVRDVLDGGPSLATVRHLPAQRSRRTTRDDATAGTQVLGGPGRTAPPPYEPGRRRERRGGSWVLALVAVAAVALVSVIAFAIGLGDDADPSPRAGAESTPSAAPTSSGAAVEGPTSEGMETFVRDYLQTASSNPSAGFAQLTPAFQAQSPRYDAFWGAVSDVQVLDMSADVDRLVVDYTYRYDLRGAGSRTEEISLRLAYDDGRYLIAGEA